MLQVNVAQLHDDNREALSLAWVAGREGRTEVRRESAAAAALIGHLNLTHPNSVQVIGTYEAGNVAGLAERLFAAAPAAVICADGVPPPASLLAEAERRCSPRRCPRRASSRSWRTTSPSAWPRPPSATAC